MASWLAVLVPSGCGSQTNGRTANEANPGAAAPSVGTLMSVPTVPEQAPVPLAADQALWRSKDIAIPYRGDWTASTVDGIEMLENGRCLVNVWQGLLGPRKTIDEVEAELRREEANDRIRVRRLERFRRQGHEAIELELEVPQGEDRLVGVHLQVACHGHEYEVRVGCHGPDAQERLPEMRDMIRGTDLGGLDFD